MLTMRGKSTNDGFIFCWILLHQTQFFSTELGQSTFFEPQVIVNLAI